MCSRKKEGAFFPSSPKYDPNQILSGNALQLLPDKPQERARHGTGTKKTRITVSQAGVIEYWVPRKTPDTCQYNSKYLSQR
mmetsp:Transcript_17763/g.25618  ORF Transcript_17763/g.25618 Transcript_17763/m.25618 type:complete len:81 (-) Transcript_17763:414-656(-)